MFLPDFVKLELQMAELMAQQEASGFRFDSDAATRVKQELQQESDELRADLIKQFPYVPGKQFTPKRNNKTKAHFAGSPMVHLEEFNPTSRQHIAWALENHRGAVFEQLTASGKAKVDEAVLSEIHEFALQHDDGALAFNCEQFIRLLTLQKWMGQLSEGTNSWLNTIESDGCIHHSCFLGTVSGRNAHKSPNLGQVVSAPWARELFVAHQNQSLVGCDLEGIEIRVLAHFLWPFDDGALAKVVLDGDVHQQNADRVNCTRPQAKTLLYAFMYGAGDERMGHSLQPELSAAAKKQLGNELRHKFLEAVPGLGPLVDAVKAKVRKSGKLKGLDGRPIFCRAEHSGLNFLCQSAGAVISKRWCVISSELLDAEGLIYGEHYSRCAYVHDEQQLSVAPGYEQIVSDILIEAAPKAGDYYKFRVPITASADVGKTWAETH